MYKHIRALGVLGALAAAATPSLAFAVTAPTDFKQLVALLIHYINLAVTIILTLAIVYYLYNTAQGIFKMRDGKIDPNWQQSMFWGIVGIAVMVSIWGLLWILIHTFGFSVSVQ